jgi:DNA-binding beta-propeller fold protein YncE
MSVRRLLVAGLVFSCALVCSAGVLFASAYGAVVTHGLVDQITESSSGMSFGEPWGLAFDSSGDLLVTENDGLDSHSPVAVFNPAGVFMAPQFALNGYRTRSVAVSAATGDVYVENSPINNSQTDVYVYKPEGAGEYGLVEGREIGGAESYLAVDNHPVEPSDPRAGDVYVLSGDTGTMSLRVFTPGAEGRLEGEGEEIPPPATGFTSVSTGNIIDRWEKAGLAVDPATGNVYVASPRNHVVDVFNDEGVEQSALELTGAETPASASSFAPVAVAIDDADEAVYVVDEANHLVDEFSLTSKWLGQIQQTTSGHDLEEPVGVAVQEHAGATKGEVYVSDLAAKTVDVFGALATLIPPQVVEGSVSAVAVTSNSATLTGEIDPWGSSTDYRFEYGTSETYGASSPVPDGQVGAGINAAEVQTPALQGLVPQTVYHFRLVAVGEVSPGVFETVYGQDETFTTQPAGREALGLVDGRQWELVSPADKHGALFFPDEGGLSIQASVDGDGIVLDASSPTEAEPQGYAGFTTVLSTRGGTGWSSQVIALPHEVATGPKFWNEYHIFSEDLSVGLVQPFGTFQAYSSEATQSTPYLRTDFVNGDVSEHCLQSCFRPLVTATNTLEHAEFGVSREGEPCGPGTEPQFITCGPIVQDATPDLNHVILKSRVKLTSTAPERGGLYEWSAGQLQYVSVLPGGEDDNSARIAGIGVPSLEERIENAGLRHAISENGERVILRTGEVAGGPLYLRDLIKEETVELGPNAIYQTANDEDSRVFFLEDGDLYECEVGEVAGRLHCELHDLTPAQDGSPAEVPEVLGASENGSYVYFTAAGALTKGATHSLCWHKTHPERADHDETCNIYLWHDGVTTLVAPGGPRFQDSRVSPDGEWLAFMSYQDLTGYDTHDAVTGRPDNEVYLYNASAGRLVCASCNPTGARPVGRYQADVEEHKAGGENQEDQLVGGVEFGTEGESVAALLPSWSEEEFQENQTLRQPRYLSDSGRLFFDSNDALVPQDVNGTMDAYEYEPPGVGSCTTSSLAYSVRSDGCVGLVSSGTSPQESAFLDASETGGDVFFLTAAKLVSEDYDDAFDVYDARECTAAASCYAAAPVAPPACSTGDSCKPAPTPQPGIFGPAASATFSGPGNVTPAVLAPVAKQKALTRAQKLARALAVCRRKDAGKSRRRGVCERTARKRYGAVSASRTAGVKRGRRV